MLRLEARAQPSRGWGYASPLLALVLTVVIGVLLFLALGKDAVAGLRVRGFDDEGDDTVRKRFPFRPASHFRCVVPAPAAGF